MRFPLTAVIAALLVAAVPPGAALAQAEPPQVQRQELMKGNGDSAQILGAMAKGERAYDATVAAGEFEKIATSIDVFVTLFPEGSETGYDTRATPQIWTDRAAFNARAEDLAEAANAAVQASGEGLESFRTAFGTVGQACRACHEEFRAPEN